MKVKALAELGEILEAGAAAAEEALVRNKMNFPLTGLHAEEIERRAIGGIGRGENVIEEGAFEVVGVAGVGLPSEEVIGQLEHVVGVAGFLGEVGQLRGEHVGRSAEVFVDAVAASGVTAVQHDLLPEKLRGITIVGVARKFKFAGSGDEFGDLGVGMEAGERVVVLRGRVHNGVMVEAFCNDEVARIVCDGREVGEDFGHAAKLGLQGALHLVLGDAASTPVGPGGHFLEDLQGLRVVAVLVHVEQAGHDFVQRVPDDGGGAAGLEVVKTGFGESGEITLVAELGLAFCEFRDHGVGFGLDARVAGGGVHLPRRGEKMADVVAAPAVARGFPIVERFGGRGEFCVDSEIVQEAIEVKSEHVVESLLAHTEQIGVEDLDVFQSERNGRQGGKGVIVRRIDAAGVLRLERADGFCDGAGGGKSRAAIKHAKKEITSDH